MLDECPVSVTRGRRSGSSTGWSRLFDAFRALTGKQRVPKPGRPHRHRSPNSEYHLTNAQLKRIIEAGYTLRDRVLVQALAGTGMRRAEVARLEIQDIRWTDCQLVIRRGKGGKSRVVPMTTDLMNRLKELIASRKSGPVFAGRNGARLSVRQVNRIVASAGQRAGVDNPNPGQRYLTCHLLRHTFARLWKEQGASVESLKKILGHASVKTTLDLYGTESFADVRRNYVKVMRRLSR